MATAPISGESVFGCSIMAGGTYVTAPIPRLIRMEMVECLISARRQWSSVTVTGIITVVDMAIEATRAMKPGTSSNKYSADKPIRSVIAIGSTGIGWIVEIPVGTYRRYSNVDGNLGRRHRGKAQQSNCESTESKRFPVGHDLSFRAFRL